MGFSFSNYRQVQSPSCSFPVSVEGQCLGLPDVLEWSVVGLVTVLKSLAMIFVELHSKEKKLWKRMGHQCWGSKYYQV